VRPTSPRDCTAGARFLRISVPLRDSTASFNLSEAVGAHWDQLRKSAAGVLECVGLGPKTRRAGRPASCTCTTRSPGIPIGADRLLGPGPTWTVEQRCGGHAVLVDSGEIHGCSCLRRKLTNFPIRSGRTWKLRLTLLVLASTSDVITTHTDWQVARRGPTSGAPEAGSLALASSPSFRHLPFVTQHALRRVTGFGVRAAPNQRARRTPID